MRKFTSDAVLDVWCKVMEVDVPTKVRGYIGVVTDTKDRGAAYGYLVHGASDSDNHLMLRGVHTNSESGFLARYHCFTFSIA